VFVWGRPSFAALSQTSGPQVAGFTDVFLMLLDGDELDMFPSGNEAEVTRHYYAGYDEEKGAVAWTQDPSEALAVIEAGQTEIVPVNQMTVAYDENLKHWLMLYGGNQVGTDKAPAEPLPGTLGYLKPTPYGEEAGGIHVRLAPNPWGPWSEPVRIYNSRPLSGGLNCKTLFDADLKEPFVKHTEVCFNDVHGSLGFSYDWRCVPIAIQGVEPDNLDLANLFNPFDVSGAEYGAAIWAGASYPYDDGKYQGASFYFAMSTFNPYQVVLMRASVAILKP
jgi:hypothetical protein